VDLVERAGQLKPLLVEFALSPRDSSSCLSTLEDAGVLVRLSGRAA